MTPEWSYARLPDGSRRLRPDGEPSADPRCGSGMLERLERLVTVLDTAFIDAEVRLAVVAVRERLSRAESALLRPSARNIVTAGRLLSEAATRLDRLTRGILDVSD
jgi:hypothetical protein